jgi:hypothetical protein
VPRGLAAPLAARGRIGWRLRTCPQGHPPAPAASPPSACRSVIVASSGSGHNLAGPLGRRSPLAGLGEQGRAHGRALERRDACHQRGPRSPACGAARAARRGVGGVEHAGEHLVVAPGQLEPALGRERLGRGRRVSSAQAAAKLSPAGRRRQREGLEGEATWRSSSCTPAATARAAARWRAARSVRPARRASAHARRPASTASRVAPASASAWPRRRRPRHVDPLAPQPAANASSASTRRLRACASGPPAPPASRRRSSSGEPLRLRERAGADEQLHEVDRQLGQRLHAAEREVAAQRGPPVHEAALDIAADDRQRREVGRQQRAADRLARGGEVRGRPARTRRPPRRPARAGARGCRAAGRRARAGRRDRVVQLGARAGQPALGAEPRRRCSSRPARPTAAPRRGRGRGPAWPVPSDRSARPHLSLQTCPQLPQLPPPPDLSLTPASPAPSDRSLTPASAARPKQARASARASAARPRSVRARQRRPRARRGARARRTCPRATAPGGRSRRRRVRSARAPARRPARPRARGSGVGERQRPAGLAGAQQGRGDAGAGLGADAARAPRAASRPARARQGRAPSRIGAVASASARSPGPRRRRRRGPATHGCLSGQVIEVRAGQPADGRAEHAPRRRDRPRERVAVAGEQVGGVGGGAAGGPDQVAASTRLAWPGVSSPWTEPAAARPRRGRGARGRRGRTRRSPAPSRRASRRWPRAGRRPTRRARRPARARWRAGRRARAGPTGARARPGSRPRRAARARAAASSRRRGGQRGDLAIAAAAASTAAQRAARSSSGPSASSPGHVGGSGRPRTVGVGGRAAIHAASQVACSSPRAAPTRSAAHTRATGPTWRACRLWISSSTTRPRPAPRRTGDGDQARALGAGQRVDHVVERTAAVRPARRQPPRRRQLGEGGAVRRDRWVQAPRRGMCRWAARRTAASGLVFGAGDAGLSEGTGAAARFSGTSWLVFGTGGAGLSEGAGAAARFSGAAWLVFGTGDAGLRGGRCGGAVQRGGLAGLRDR